MQVVSGPIGRQRVHFQAPPADCLEAETSRFLAWVNGATKEPPLLKAGLGHLWFVTLHPFDTVLAKARFWQRWATTPLNARQVKLLNILLNGVEGKLTSSKWATLAACSPDTALRDITDLLTKGVLRKSDAGGRSTSYELKDGTGYP
jgi:Fic family protein